MKLLLCAALCATVFTGVYGYPSDATVPQNKESADQQTKTFFEVPMAPLNMILSKNGTFLPESSFIKFNTSYADEIGMLGNVLIPLPKPFAMPFAMLFPSYPKANLTVAFTNKKNYTIDVDAGMEFGGNQTSAMGTQINQPHPPNNGWRALDGLRNANVMGKPPVGEHPRPNLLLKPTLNVAEAMQLSTNPAEHQVGNVAFGNNVIESVVVSSSPLAEANLYAAQDSQVDSDDVLMNYAPVGDVFANLAIAPVLEGPAQPVEDVKVPEDNLKSKVPALLNSTPGKSRRHADVEHPSSLRIEEFDEETPSDADAVQIHSQSTDTGENLNQDISKEEMILLAMEQAHQMAPGMQLSLARPHPMVPGPMNLAPLSIQANRRPVAPPVVNSPEEDVGSEHTSDARNKESSLTQAVPNKTEPGKQKPRPYGMDHAKNRPSKPRPTLDSGVKEKEQHFGLPHSSDYVQKEQMEISGGSSVLGWQLPSMRWPSFTNLFQNFMGNRQKTSLAKSEFFDADGSVKGCEDDDVDEFIRSPTIQSGSLCQSGGAQSHCDKLCISKGFASGNCLGPAPTPGCMCNMPNSKQYGLMLSPLEKTEDNQKQDVKISAAPGCKKCACTDACKKRGSYMGICANQCFCADPWYTNRL